MSKYLVDMETYWVKWDKTQLEKYYNKNITDYNSYDDWINDLVRYGLVKISN